MQINLKKPEIETAITHYIMSQGISLKGKDVSIKFTYGRGDVGVSAEVSIDDDRQIPDFGEFGDEETSAKLALVRPVTSPEAEHPIQEDQPQPEEEVVQAKTTTSLFN
jgi:hypothetical protein